MDIATSQKAGQRPLVLSVCFRAMIHRMFGCAAPPQIDWEDTLAEILARTLVGVVLGGASCLLLFPIIFWPGRRGRPSLYDRWGEPDWIAWMFIAPLVGAIVFRIALTRATVRDAGKGQLPDHFHDVR